MCEPLSIITGVASLVTVCVKISQSLGTLKDKFQFAQRTIASLGSECSATCMGLSQLHNAFQNRPEILNTFGHSREELMICFDMVTWGIADAFSSLDAELTRLNIEMSRGGNRLGFLRKGRYLWNEDRVQILAQQIREQRSSISFLLQGIQLNQHPNSSAVFANDPEFKTNLRRNYTKAKSLRSQRSNSTIRGTYASDLDGFLERGSRDQSYETTLLQSQPYIQAQYPHAQVHKERSLCKDGDRSISQSEVDADTSIPSQDFVDRRFHTENTAQLQADLSNTLLQKDNPEGLIARNSLATRSDPPEAESVEYPDRGLATLPDVRPVPGTVENPLETSVYRTQEDDYTTIDVHCNERGLFSQESNLDFHKQIADGNIAGVKVLLKAGVDINHIAELDGDSSLGYSPLGRAILKNHIKMAKLLLKHGAGLDSFAVSKVGYTALHLATSQNRAEIVKALLQAGSDITNRTPGRCETALFIACRKDLPSLASLLLEGNGVLALETPDCDGKSPLLEAIPCGFIGIIEALLQAGADVHHRTPRGDTSLHVAVREGHVAIANLLIRHGADQDARNQKSETPLHFAVGNQRSEMIKLLLDSGASFDVMSDEGYTPLMLAAMKDNTTTMNSLLEKGADITLSSVYGLTTLHYAAFGSVNALKFLLSRGVDLEEVTKDGSTSLVLAAEKGHVEIVKLLLQANARVDYCGGEDGTALHMAAYGGHEEVCEVLLEHGATIDNRDFRGGTPLIDAVMKKRIAVAILLLSRGADVNAQDQKGCSVLYFATEKGHIHTVKVLLDAGATINIKTKKGATPLHYAAYNGHRKVVEFLLAKGADINAQNQEGCSVLYFAAKKGHIHTVKVLLDAGATIDIKTKEGATPLYYAAYNGHLKVVELLLQRGADRSSIAGRSDMKGTPEQVAREKGHHGVADLIKNFHEPTYGSIGDSAMSTNNMTSSTL